MSSSKELAFTRVFSDIEVASVYDQPGGSAMIYIHSNDIQHILN